MAKKSKKGQPSITAGEKDVKVSKQAVGGVTGAVLSAMVAGPLGAIAGGFAGAVVGEQSARGRKPVKKTVDTIRSEIRSAKPLEALKSVAEKTKSLVTGKKSKTAKSGSAKKAVKKSTAKAAAKGAKTKKRVKKKR